MVRPNSVIAIGASEEGPEYEYEQGVTFRLYEIKDHAKDVVYGKNGEKAAELTVDVKDGEMTIHCTEGIGATVELYNVSYKNVDGAESHRMDNKLVLTNCTGTIHCN